MEGIHSCCAPADRCLPYTLCGIYPLQLCQPAASGPSSAHPLAGKHRVRAHHPAPGGSLRASNRHATQPLGLCQGNTQCRQGACILLRNSGPAEVQRGMFGHLLYSQFPLTLLVGVAHSGQCGSHAAHAGQPMGQMAQHQAGANLHAEPQEPRDSERSRL